MVSEFHQLVEKVAQLAELTQALRRENSELRQQAAAVSAENADLFRRMEQAHERVAALLEKLPLSEQDEEAA
jgi:uncharacterized protein (TIGR02449 family)